MLCRLGPKKLKRGGGPPGREAVPGRCPTHEPRALFCSAMASAAFHAFTLQCSAALSLCRRGARKFSPACFVRSAKIAITKLVSRSGAPIARTRSDKMWLRRRLWSRASYDARREISKRRPRGVLGTPMLAARERAGKNGPSSLGARSTTPPDAYRTGRGLMVRLAVKGGRWRSRRFA